MQQTILQEQRLEVGPPSEYRSVATGRYPNMTEEFVRERRARIERSFNGGKTPRIEVGSTDMRCLFGSRVECYLPTLGGAPLAVEAGITQNSINNVYEIAGELGLPLVVRAYEGSQFEFWFPGSEVYVATGFGIGYVGTGPAGLAEILVEFNNPDAVKSHDAVIKMRRQLYTMPQDFSGEVRRYLGRHNSQPSKKSWVVGAVMNAHGLVL